jgi:hypothetical protein
MANPLTNAEVADQLSSCPGCPNWDAMRAELVQARTRVADLEGQMILFRERLDVIIAAIDADLAIEAEILDTRVTAGGSG